MDAVETVQEEVLKGNIDLLFMFSTHIHTHQRQSQTKECRKQQTSIWFDSLS